MVINVEQCIYLPVLPDSSLQLHTNDHTLYNLLNYVVLEVLVTPGHAHMNEPYMQRSTDKVLHLKIIWTHFLNNSYIWFSNTNYKLLQITDTHKGLQFRHQIYKKYCNTQLPLL